MKHKKRRAGRLIAAILALCCLTCGCALLEDEPDEPDVPGDEEVVFDPETFFISIDHPGETPGTGYKPVYDITITGNFQDIDEAVFKNSDYAPDEVVGRWYEEGYTNGYCLELYGDGTWQYFGEETRTGLYEIMNSSMTLIDGFYGVDIAGVMPYDADGKTLSLWTYALLPTRTRAEQVRFYPEEDSTYLEDIEAYYDARYPNRYLTGFWFPVGDYLGEHYYVFDEKGNFSESKERQIVDVYFTEQIGEGRFIGTSINFEDSEVKNIEYPGDGYLYVNGIQYERTAQEEGTAPDGVVGRWRFLGPEYDTFYDCGYEFNSDWTFRSIPDDPPLEHGTFVVVGADLILYDDYGYRMHVLYQDEFNFKQSIRVDLPGNNFAWLFYEPSIESDGK